jgi:prepilin peptidase CpaA
MTFPITVVLTATLIGTVTDLWRYKLYNLLTLPLLISGLIYHSAVGGSPGFGTSFLGALFGFSSLFLFHLMGGVGGGDVKLMAGVGAWLGLPLTFFVFIAAGLVAGVYAIILITISGRLRETWLNLKVLWYRLVAVTRQIGGEDRIELEVNRPDRRLRLIPFAAVVAVGLLMVIAGAWLGTRP